MSNQERSILAATIKDRKAYDSIEADVKTDDLTAQARIIWLSIKEYYAIDEAARSVDPDILRRSVERQVSNPKHRAAFATMVEQLSELEVSPPNVVADMVRMKRDLITNKLQAALAGTDQKVIANLMEEYTKCGTGEALEEIPVGHSGEALIEMAKKSVDPKELIKILPKALNIALGGGALRGHHLILFARPEIGKTMFLVNSIAGFLRQKLRVTYCGNEDPLQDIAGRVLGRLSDMTEEERAADPELMAVRGRQHHIDKLVCFHMEPGTARVVDKICQATKPDVLIVDQLRNLTSAGDGFTQQLEHNARDIRTVGQKHNCLVLSVTQAGGTADGKDILDMSDVDSSKTGIPAQADIMCGMGGTAQDVDNNQRTLSLCKNKRNGNHAIIPIAVNPQLSKLTG